MRFDVLEQKCLLVGLEITLLANVMDSFRAITIAGGRVVRRVDELG